MFAIVNIINNAMNKALIHVAAIAGRLAYIFIDNEKLIATDGVGMVVKKASIPEGFQGRIPADRKAWNAAAWKKRGVNYIQFEAEPGILRGWRDVLPTVGQYREATVVRLDAERLRILARAVSEEGFVTLIIPPKASITEANLTGYNYDADPIGIVGDADGEQDSFGILMPARLNGDEKERFIKALEKARGSPGQ